MKIITATSNGFIVEISDEEFAGLTGLKKTSHEDYYVSEMKKREGKEYDLSTQLKKMRELQVAFETKHKVSDNLKKILESVENSMWPIEEIK